LSDFEDDCYFEKADMGMKDRLLAACLRGEFSILRKRAAKSAEWVNSGTDLPFSPTMSPDGILYQNAQAALAQIIPGGLYHYSLSFGPLNLESGLPR
jgi:hypothetical protein